ncbi:MAG: hypothetical protein HYV07_22515 [Deltaproteobacteria bacterium]|nr:hypothetical protein [Deltaproteobacteria bacterium]
MSDQKPPDKLVSAALIGLAVAVVVGVALIDREPAQTPVSGKLEPRPASVEGLPDTSKPVALAVPDHLERTVAVAIDVFEPAKVLTALRANEWLKRQTQAPLGEGFLGSWAGFLGSRGDDLGASFAGTVIEHLTSSLLDKQFRIAWLASESSVGAPIILASQPSAAALAAYSSFDEVVRRGTYTADRCPEEQPGARAIQVTRWVAADRAIYAAKVEAPSTLVIGRTPGSVLEAVCLVIAKAPGTTMGARSEGSDLEVVLSSDQLGRATQSLVAFSGLEPNPRLAFAVEAGAFVPRGIGAALKGAPRLSTESGPASLLGVIPSEIPVALTLGLRPPDALDDESLAKWLAGESVGARTVPAALLWRPRGRKTPSEVALVWSRASDREALEKIFAGPNRLRVSESCGHLVLSSNEELARTIDRTCRKELPSLLHGSPALATGLTAPSSMSLVIHLGSLMRGALVDAYSAQHPQKTDPKSKQPRESLVFPKELEEAIDALEQLPSLGFAGSVEGGRWVARGFRS